MPRLYMQEKRLVAGADENEAAAAAAAAAMMQLGRHIEEHSSIGGGKKSPRTLLRAIDKHHPRHNRRVAMRSIRKTNHPRPPLFPATVLSLHSRRGGFCCPPSPPPPSTTTMLNPLRRIGGGSDQEQESLKTPRESKVPERVRVAAAMLPKLFSPSSSSSSDDDGDGQNKEEQRRGKKRKSLALSDREYMRAGGDAEMRRFFSAPFSQDVQEEEEEEPALLFSRPLEEINAFGYTGCAFVREVDFCREFCSERGMQICMGLPPALDASPERQIFFMKCKNMVLQAYADLANEGVFVHMHAVELATLMCLWLSVSGWSESSSAGFAIQRMSLSHEMLPKTAACMISIAMKHAENVRVPYHHLHRWIDRARELDASWAEAAFPTTHAMEADIMCRIGWRVWHRPTVSSMLFVAGLMRPPGYPDECYEKLRFIVSSVLLAEAQTCSDASLLTVRCMDPAALALACFDVMVHGCSDDAVREMARCGGVLEEEEEEAEAAAPVWIRAALIAHARAQILKVADESNTLLLRRAPGGEGAAAAASSSYFHKDPYYACLRALVGRAACSSCAT